MSLGGRKTGRDAVPVGIVPFAVAAVVFCLLVIPALAFGIPPILGYYRTAERVEAAQSWLETPCTVVSFETYQTPSAQRGHKRTHYELSYEYRIFGKPYRSSRLDFNSGSLGNELDWAQELRETLPPGTETTCYVNPDNREDAVMFRDRLLDTRLPGLTIIGVAMVIGGVLSTNLGLRYASYLRRRKRA